MNGSSGGFGGIMARASRFPEFLVLGTSAWRKYSTAKISECKEKRVEIFRWSVRKILPEPCVEKSPLGDIEGNTEKMLIYQCFKLR